MGLLLGYAIGTLQVLILDWYRHRREHRRHLRALRAELERILGFIKKFEWNAETGPSSDFLPNPPSVSPRYFELVTSIDFYLTDEHSNDNAQVAFMNIADGCNLLGRHHDQLIETVEQLEAATDPGKRRRQLKEKAIALAGFYDEFIDILAYTCEDALREIRRRLFEASLWRQLNRPFGKLPPGENPPSLSRGDARLKTRAIPSTD